MNAPDSHKRNPPHRTALSRVGAQAHKRLQWVLNFNSCALEAVDPTNWQRLQEEITVFQQIGMLGLQGHRIRREDLQRLAQQPIEAKLVIGLVTRLFAKEIQTISREAITGLIVSGQAGLQISSGKMLLMRTTRGVSAVRVPDKTTGPFVDHLSSLLIEAGHALANCGADNCNRRYFVKNRKSQRFCSATCKGRVNMRRLRDRQRDTMISPTCPNASDAKKVGLTERTAIKGDSRGKKRRG